MYYKTSLNKVFLIATCLLIAVNVKTYSQNKNIKFSDNLYLAGSFGLQIGKFTAIEFSPIVGYEFNDYLQAGVGLKYIYESYNHEIYGYHTSIFGINLFGDAFIIKNLRKILPFRTNTELFLHAEYEILSLESIYFAPFSDRNRVYAHGLLPGIGLRQYINQKSSVDIVVLWNIIEQDISAYSNPVIRMIFNF